MFGRLLNYLSGLWLAHKPDAGRGSRFEIGGVVVNLTGRGNATRDCAWPEAGLRTTMLCREINAEQLSATELLGEIESGSRPRSLLPWVALMTGGGDADTVEWWKRLADAEPTHRVRATYGAMARVLADAAGRHSLGTESLKRWNMRESPTVNGWIEEGRVEGQQQGRQQGRLELLEAILTTKFGQLPAGTMDRLRALPDDQLKALSVRFVTATTLADLGL